MVDLAGFRQINDLVAREARFIHSLEAEIRKSIIGQDRLVERTLGGATRRRSHPSRGRAGPCQNASGQDDRTGDRCRVLAHTVHP